MAALGYIRGLIWIESGTITRLKKLQGMSWSFFWVVSNFLGKPQENSR
jgi:hypothetical protein